MIIPNNDFLAENKSKYEEYDKLTPYQKKCLSATNYWRLINGLKAIDVPSEDYEYYNYFNKKCLKNVKR